MTDDLPGFVGSLVVSIGFGAGFIFSLSFSISNATKLLVIEAKSLSSAFGDASMISLCNATA